MSKLHTMSKILIAAFFTFVSITSIQADEKKAAFTPQLVTVNQLGYPSDAQKLAVVMDNRTTPIDWQIYDWASNTYVLEGKTKVFGRDPASNKHLHHVDFSKLTKVGHYLVNVTGSPSYSFKINNKLFESMPKDALAYFYFHRMGNDIESQYLDDPRHARMAIHPGDDKVACFEDWCGKDVELNVKHSWADAGDFGIYAVNHAISAWSLLNAYEFDPKAHKDGDANIPESNNGIPDILDEVRYGSTFVAGLLPPGNQLASHKVHNKNWTPYPLDIPIENGYERYAQPPSTAATYAVSRVTAHLARSFKRYDKAYAKEQWRVAQVAWERSIQHEELLYLGSTKDSNGGGDYPDGHIEDDQYAALAELLITAVRFKDKKAAAKYRKLIVKNKHYLSMNDTNEPYWSRVESTASMSLHLHWKMLGLKSSDKKVLEKNILAAAQRHLDTQMKSGYPTSYNPYTEKSRKAWMWGSNGQLVNYMIELAYAHKISGDKKYLQGIYYNWDYLLGNNPLNLSYVTGYGSNPERDTLDGFAWTKLRKDGVPYPKGWLSGGPMNDPNTCHGEPMTDLTAPPAVAYAPVGTGSRAWCSKENTVNWNAPFYWIAQYTKQHGLR